MPNWCYNSINIEHDDPAMITRLDNARKAPLQEFIPCPHDPATSDKWYDWRVNHWGTKWDIELSDISISDDGKNLNAHFDSAWAPPIEAYHALVNMGFRIDAIYSEPGAAFYGCFDEEGDHSFEYPNFADADWRKGVPDALVGLMENDYEAWLEWQKEEEEESCE